LAKVTAMTPREMLDAVRALPPVMRAADCAGMLYGRPIPVKMWCEWILADLWQEAYFFPVMAYAEATECAYCGRAIRPGDMKRHSSCPTCAGPWEEALVRVG
jgi:hypothetical protein